MIKKILTLAFITFTIAGCAIFQSPSEPAVKVSYATDIAPIIATKCSPCHFPEKGKVAYLHTYELVRREISDILYRVQLKPSSKDYMPFKQKKEAVTEAEVALMQQWKAEGFAK